MASTSSKPCMPTAGRYPAKVGKSLTRVIKARKGEPPQKSKFPEPDFYSLRYNFIPPSVDSAKPGTIEVRKGPDVTSVTVERANSQTEEGGHIFVGAETTAKEVECVLIYDEVLGSFTLEKLDSYVNLTYDRKTTKAPRRTVSPLPPSRPSTSTSTSSHTPLAYNTKKRPQTAAEQLEADLLGEDMDAVAEPDNDFDDLLLPEPPKKSAPPNTETALAKNDKTLSFKKARPATLAQKIIKKEEEEESEGEVKRPTELSAPIPKPPVKIKKKSLAAAAADLRRNAAATSSMPPATQSHTPPIPPTHPLPPKPLSTSLPLAVEPARKPLKALPKKRDLPPDTSAPAPAAKKTRSSPPLKTTPVRSTPLKKEPPKKKEPVSLALPGSDGVTLPSALLELPDPLQPDATAPALPGDDSDEEEWEQVPQVASAIKKANSPEPPVRRIEMIEIIPEPTAHRGPVGVSEDLVMEEDEGDDDDGGDEIDENELHELQRQLEEQSEYEEDPEAYQMEQPEPPQFTGVPLSMNALAGQLEDEDEDDSDDVTTSDESD